MPGLTLIPSQSGAAADLDANSLFWYNAFRDMLEKLLQQSCYSEQRRDDILSFFASHMVPFLGPVPKLSARRWRSFMTQDHTPAEPSLAWSASRPDPRTRLAIDIIPADASDRPAATAQRAIDFAAALRAYADGRNTVQITSLDLELFYIIAEQLFVPMLENTSVEELIAEVPSGPSLTFFGVDIEETSSKVKAYFIPALTALALDQHPVQVLSNTFLSIGEFPAWAAILGYLATLPFDEMPVPFILSVDCVPRAVARYKTYFRCKVSGPEELISHMSLGGQLPLTRGFIDGVLALWRLLAPRTDQLDSQDVYAETGLCLYYDFKESSQYPAVKVYLPAQNWSSNDLKVAHAISQWLGEFGHPESAKSYLSFASDLCDRPLGTTSGFHTYVGIAPSKSGDGCEATTYYNLNMFRQSP